MFPILLQNQVFQRVYFSHLRRRILASCQPEVGIVADAILEVF